MKVVMVKYCGECPYCVLNEDTFFCIYNCRDMKQIVSPGDISFWCPLEDAENIP